MESIEIFGILAVPLIVGLVEAAKAMGLPARWAALLALALGVLLSMAATDAANPLVGAVVRGLALGLAASGLYAGARAVGRSGATPTGAISGQSPADR